MTYTEFNPVDDSGEMVITSRETPLKLIAAVNDVYDAKAMAMTNKAFFIYDMAIKILILNYKDNQKYSFLHPIYNKKRDYI